MSASKDNPCDIEKVDPEPVKPSIETNMDVTSDSSINTPKQTDNTSKSPSMRVSSHDNKEDTNDEVSDATNKPVMPENESKEAAKGKPSVAWAMPSPVNKVTPQALPNVKALDSKVTDKKASKDDKILSVEEPGDSDSSSTPLIQKIDRSQSQKKSSAIRLEKIPGAVESSPDKILRKENSPLPDIKTSPPNALRKAFFDEMTGINNQKGEAEKDENNTTSSPDVSPPKEKSKEPDSPEIEHILGNKKRLDRTTSSPPTKTTSAKLDGALSPIREFKTFSSYEKGGETTLEELINTLENKPNDLVIPYLKIEKLAENENTAADVDEMKDDTGETIMHHLAKEGCVEVLRKILQDLKIEKPKLVQALTMRDKAGWSPLMAAVKADKNVEEVLDLFLLFLEEHAKTSDVDDLTMTNPEILNGDNIFTLLISSHTCGSFDHIQTLFNILCKRAENMKMLFDWLTRIVDELSKANSCDLGAKEMRRVIDFLLKSAISVKKEKIENNKNMKGVESGKDYNEYKRQILQEFLRHQDEEGNNVLMILAKHIMDGALREMLTNDHTMEYITHSVLSIRNNLRQTILSIIEVNREDMPESLALVLKVEYACHAGDLTQAEICLSGQLETSNSSFEIIKGLHQLQQLSWCQKFNIWVILFLTWLVPNYGLTVFDWSSDGYLAYEYWNEWSKEEGKFQAVCNNATIALNSHWIKEGIFNTTNALIASTSCSAHNASAMKQQCNASSYNLPHEVYDQCDPLSAYASCLSGETKFWYTLVPTIGPVILYMVEFFVLTEDYEPTGLRRRIKDTWKQLIHPSEPRLHWYSPIQNFLRLIYLVVLTILAIIFWMPVSAWCKFKTDGKYQTSTGIEKVKMRRNKRCMDLAASRGELMEVCIEDVFEPMIQLYIIFPGMISIVRRLEDSIKPTSNDTISFNMELSTIELGQIFSIGISIVSLAWCYSEYASVRKNMYLDPSESPFSRSIMWFMMVCQIMARLFAFMLFTLYFNPGDFYPLMIFILIHMILAGFLHVIFSDDLNYCRKGKYFKFFHNVIFNALSSIYFHSYIHQDESSDVIQEQQEKEEKANKDSPKSNINDSGKPQGANSSEFIQPKENKSSRVKIQNGNLHTSTLFRQIMFDILYTIEFGVLLGFGFYSRPFHDKTSILFCSNFYIILAIVILYFIALLLRCVYYTAMHVWSNVIWSSKRLHRKELTTKGVDEVDVTKPVVQTEIEKANIRTQEKFFKYVFVCRNTWILGEIKHVEITLMILPKWIIDKLKYAGESLILASDKMRDQVRVWFATFTCSCPGLLFKIRDILISFLLFTVIFVVLNILAIGILLVLFSLLIPVMLILFVLNLKKGCVATDEGDFQEILEEPPDINEEILFKEYPNVTLFSLQQGLKNEDGLVNLKNLEQIYPQEFGLLTHKLLALDHKKYPMKTLDLTNCCVTDEEMKHLAPLIAKFDRVILNGIQSLSLKGFTTLKKVLYRMSVIPMSVKLKALELKIERKKGDVIKEGRALLLGDHSTGAILEYGNNYLSEFEGLAMDGNSLRVITEFLTKLEEIHLDGVFMETSIYSKMKEKAEVVQTTGKKTMNTIARKESQQTYTKEEDVESDMSEAWKGVRKVILETPESKQKLRCFSINRCQVNDSILKTLAPALVTIEKVNLAENPGITKVGWEKLAENLTGNYKMNYLSLKVSRHAISNKHRIMNKEEDMLPLARVLSKIETVDISGQKESTSTLIDLLVNLSTSEPEAFKLQLIIVSRAYDTIARNKTTSFKIEYSDSTITTQIVRQSIVLNSKDQINQTEDMV